MEGVRALHPDMFELEDYFSGLRVEPQEQGFNIHLEHAHDEYFPLFITVRSDDDVTTFWGDLTGIRPYHQELWQKNGNVYTLKVRTWTSPVVELFIQVTSAHSDRLDVEVNNHVINVI